MWEDRVEETDRTHWWVTWGRGGWDPWVQAVGVIIKRSFPFFSGVLTRKNTDFDEHPK